MKSQEQINKIEAVVLYILQHFKDGVDYVKLFKIMYFAQRKYLATYGRPIIEDTFRARELGPVPSLAYKVVKMVEFDEDFNDEAPDLKDFAKSIRVDTKQMVYATAKPDVDYIAAMELKFLDDAITQYGSIDSKELSKMSHDSAYKKVEKLMKDDPEKDVLTLIDIARAGKASKEMINYLREGEMLKRILS